MNPALEGLLLYFSIIAALGIWALILMYLEHRDVRKQRRQ
jgi:hypothetical protein